MLSLLGAGQGQNGNYVDKLISEFKARVLANNGTFEAESCLKTTLKQIDSSGIIEKVSLLATPNSLGTSKLYSIIPINGAGDLQFIRNTAGTYINYNKLLATNFNVARLDYTNSNCPSILVEPQRTNLLPYSNDFTQGWSVTEGVSLSANTTASPTGSINASTLSELAVNDVHRTYRNTAIATTSDVDYTFSFFVKKDTIRYVRLIITNSASTTIWVASQFDLDTQTFTSGIGSGGGIFRSASIIPISNGWFRISLTASISGTSLRPVLALSNGASILSTDSRGCNIYFGNTNNKLFYFGGQFELGSNVSSYIPTTSTVVTRNLDLIRKLSISSLIGQTEGTFYSEIQFFEGGARFNGIELFGNSGNRIFISKDTNDLIIAGFQANSIATNVGSFNSSYNKIKIAIRYKSGNSVVYVNGVNVGSSSATFNFTTSINTLNCNVANNSAYTLQGRLFSCCVFPLGLTNLELQQLTTL